MSSFGDAGKRTVRHFDPAATVQFGDGDFVHYKLTVVGAEAHFAFTCKDRDNLLTHDDFPDHPTDLYEWDLGEGKTCEPDSDDDVYGLGMQFTSADKYTLVVEHRRANNTVIANQIDVDYESTVNTDKFIEILNVFAV